MAVNNSRNMGESLIQGMRDGRYMQLNPDWDGPLSDYHAERTSWPTYQSVERHLPDRNITKRPSINTQTFTEPRHRPALGG